MDRFHTLHKIKCSRDNIRRDLEAEWDTSVIQDFSELELQKLYTSKHSKNVLLSFGVASACNFTLYHRFVSNHKLRIIYYNFPELGSPPIKITKTCADKINALYTEETIDPEDSLMIILFNPASQSVDKSIETLYSKGQEELKINGLSEEIKINNELLNEKKYSYTHFKNIHVFHLDALAIDIVNHSCVPKHEIIRDYPSIQKILKQCNSHISQLPIILRTDSQAKRLRLAPGDICKITRVTQTGGEVPYYRVCK